MSLSAWELTFAIAIGTAIGNIAAMFVASTIRPGVDAWIARRYIERRKREVPRPSPNFCPACGTRITIVSRDPVAIGYCEKWNPVGPVDNGGER